MEVSFLSRLTGAWGGAIAAINSEPDLALAQQWGQSLWKQLATKGFVDVRNLQFHFGEDALINGLGVLPLLLFFHEDPLYLGDRLGDLPLPPQHQRITSELGMLISACMREIYGLDQLPLWIKQASQLDSKGCEVWLRLYRQQSPWRQFVKQIQGLELAIADTQLLIIYGALTWGKGHWHNCLALVQGEAPIVQAWVQVLLGSFRGDRQQPLSHRNLVIDLRLRQDIQQFWSRWSGLPPENQLHLDQLPIIANCQVIQGRPELKLLSQRHLM